MVNIICYKSKTLSNGEHPLMIRVCKDGRKKYQSIGIPVKTRILGFSEKQTKSKLSLQSYLLCII
jgi:hypothetical protein